LAVVANFPATEPGALQQTINSGAGINYCGYNASITPTVGTTFSLAPNCVAAADLNTALQAYNPGWSEGFGANAAHWIGPTDHLDANFPSALSNQYVADVGSYSFVTTFDGGDAAATNRALELQIMSDNAAAVYLNGVYIGGNQDGVGNPLFQDCPTQQTNCNWTQAGSVKITGVPIAGTNTLRVDLVGTAIGYQVSGTPRSNCTNGPQFTGFLGFTSTTTPTPQHKASAGPPPVASNWTSCKNPTGVDFTARVYFSNPVVVTTWCSPGFWKNHNSNPPWPAGYQTLKYNDFSASYVNQPKTFIGYDFGKKVGSTNPSLYDVISQPSIYGGPATNNVADILSNVVFGTVIGTGVESCPDPSSPLFNPRA